jgi:hypothetical protein
LGIASAVFLGLSPAGGTLEHYLPVFYIYIYIYIYIYREREREREREKRHWGVVVRDTTVGGGGGGEKAIYSV